MSTARSTFHDMNQLQPADPNAHPPMPAVFGLISAAFHQLARAVVKLGRYLISVSACLFEHATMPRQSGAVAQAIWGNKGVHTLRLHAPPLSLLNTAQGRPALRHAL